MRAWQSPARPGTALGTRTGLVHAIEPFEDLCLMLRCNALAGVRDFDGRFAPASRAVDRDSPKWTPSAFSSTGDYVALHSEYNLFGNKIGFDIFRFENGKIVEHWDNLQAKADKNPSGRTMIDGPTEIRDR